MKVQRTLLCRLLLFVITTFPVPGLTQTNFDEQQGLKPYDSWHGGDLDSVSLTSGALALHIPLLSYPQRGSLDLSFSLTFSGKDWTVYSHCSQNGHGGQDCTNKWVPVPRSGAKVATLTSLTTVTGAYISSSTDWLLEHPVDSSQPQYFASVVSPDGNVHQFGSAFSAITFPMRSLDASGLMHLDGSTVVLPNGTRLAYTTTPPINGSGVQPATVTDANGNQITMNASGWTDTLGRAVPGSAGYSVATEPGIATTDLSTCPSGTSNARVWDVPALNAGTRRFKLCYSLVSIHTNFQTGPTEYPATNTLLLTAVVLPDATMWTLQYDNYGNLLRLGLPTGGSISYTYSTGPLSCQPTHASMWVASRTVDANDGTGGHTWNYHYSGQYTNTQNGIIYSGQTKVTSPDGNDTVHTITSPVPGSYCSLYDTQIQYYQGAAGGTLLKTVSTQYTGIQDVYDGTPEIGMNIVAAQATAAWPGGQTTKVVNTFDLGNSFTEDGGTIPVVFGSLMQRDDYDFSNNLVRSTVNHYLWQDNSTYKTNNFLSLPVSSIVKTGAGCEVAKTSHGYDETYNGVTTQNALVSMHHGNPPGAVRGNHTSSSKSLISDCAEQSSITAHTIPYDTGVPYQSYDPLSHMTQYTYDPAFYGAYLTQTNLPDTQMPDTGAPVVHHIVSGNYDFNTGLLTSFTDENSQSFTYQYDNMLRLTQGNHPDGGQTLFTYPDPLTVSRQRLITTGVYDSYTAKFDGLGRPIQSQQITPSGTILTDTTYDIVGRVATVSNPYYQGSNHQSDPTYGVTSTQYDALSRATRTTKQDLSFTTVTYTDNCATVTDESGKSRKSCADALGRMATVFEDPSGLNYETDYQYDILNNMLRVDQKGSAPGDSTRWRTRLFTYDSLSQLLTASNPENGMMCYGIWFGGSCINGYDADGNLLKKTDARGITVTYAYDALNRLTDKTYSDSTPQASFRYDYATFLGQSFSYPVGREVAATSAANTIEYFTSYDKMGRVAGTVQCNPGVTGCKTFTASYDKLGDLTNMVYPNSLSVSYQYDSAARLYNAADSTGWNYASLVNTSQTYFLPAGAMGRIDTPNFKYTNSFNNRLQPTEITAQMTVGSSDILFDKTYGYNPPGLSQVNNGSIYTVTNVKDSSRTQTFTYDALNRLATAQDATHWSNAYTYDAWGNLTKKHYGPIPAGEYMDTSALTNNQLVGYGYDAGGNMTTDGINGWTYVFDGESRITSAGGVTYTYDADGRRVKKSSGTNYWYGPGGQVFAETDGSGAWTNYVFFGGQRLARNVNGDIKYYITDHLHSTAVFADKTGSILDDNDFYPWGGAVPGVGQTTSNNAIKFTGQYRDTESQLDYFGARYYANSMGRFMTPDWSAKPVTVPYANFGDPQSLNLYSYVGNSPIVRTDAVGHAAAGMDGLRAAPGSGGMGSEGFDGDNEFELADRVFWSVGDGSRVFDPPDEAEQQPQQQPAQKQNKPTVTVTTDLYTNQARDKGYSGAQIQLTATVKGDDSVAYNWDQTVTTSNPTGKDQKPNVPFKDAAPDTGLYWSAKDQKRAMDTAAKDGATTIFSDAPQRFGGVPFTFHATLSLIGIGKDGTHKTLWTATWGVKVTVKSVTLEPLRVLTP